MVKSRRKTLAFVGLLVLLGLYPADRLLSRSGRIVYSRMERDLMTVRDEILRYQYEHGNIPDDLGALIPSHLRREQLYDAEGPLYTYSSAERVIALRTGMTVWGLLPHDCPVIRYELPVAQSTAKNERVQQSNEVKEPRRKVAALTGGDRQPTPKGALVFEAEHYTDTNYGWEIKPDPNASGGAYIHSKEGIANGPGQIYSRIFDFYSFKESKEYNYLKYHINVPESGRYSIYGRLWTTSSHCSNTLHLGVDVDWSGAKEYRDFSGRLIMQNRSPFQWVWTQAGNHSPYFTKGEHVLNVFLHEDGVRLDQIMLCRHLESGGDVYEPNLVPGEATSVVSGRALPLDMTLDLKSAVISKNMPPQANVFIRRFKALSGDGTMTVSLEGAGVELETYTLSLEDMPELGYLPVDFSAIDFDSLPRREYALVAELAKDGKVLGRVRTPLMHHMVWEVSPAIGYLLGFKAGPLDGALEDASIPWEPMKDRSWTHFGVMDFGLQTINNSLQAPTMKTIYAKTRIVVPETGEYLLKLQSDDQMLLWVDGTFVYFHSQMGPVTRSAKRLRIQLDKGHHDVRIRVNQRRADSYGDGRWQAFLRFRTVDDELCGIRWVPKK